MSSNQIKVPVITVVPESEDTDDQKLLTLEEALTDIEDLDTDNTQGNIGPKYFKSKLKIILTDDEATDIEDMVASDNEEETSRNVRSPTLGEVETINNDLTLEVETYEKERGRSRGETTTYKQLLKSTGNTKRLSLIAPIAEDGLTDVEQLITSDEESELELPDIILKPEWYDPKNREFIHETLKNSAVQAPSPAVTPIKNLKALAYDVTDVSDIEMQQDVKTNKECAKKIKKRKHRGSNFNSSVKEAPNAVNSNSKLQKQKKCESKESRNLYVHSDDLECNTDVEEIQLQGCGSSEHVKAASKRNINRLEVAGKVINNEPVTDVEEYDTDDENMDMPRKKSLSKSKPESRKPRICATQQYMSSKKYNNNKKCNAKLPKFNKTTNTKQSSTVIRQIERKLENLCVAIAEVVPTDEEMMSSDAEDTYETPFKRQATPDLPRYEGGTVRAKESFTIQKNGMLLVNTEQDPITDTEELEFVNKEDRQKRKLCNKQALFVPQKEIEAETETEELYPSDKEHPMSNLKTNKNANQVYSGTETEHVFTSDDEDNCFIKTPFHSESDNETVINKATHKNKHFLSLSNDYSKSVTPTCTDIDELEASSNEENPTIQRATPEGVYKALNNVSRSKVHTEQSKKIDLTTPSERLYIKGEIIEDLHTEQEDVTATDSESVSSFKGHRRFSVDLTDDKITITVTQTHCGSYTKWRNCSFCFGSYGKGKIRAKALVIFGIATLLKQVRYAC